MAAESICLCAMVTAIVGAGVVDWCVFENLATTHHVLATGCTSCGRPAVWWAIV